MHVFIAVLLGCFYDKGIREKKVVFLKIYVPEIDGCHGNGTCRRYVG